MTYVAAVLADTPKAFWECQDASGNAVDSSGNGLNFTSITTGGGGFVNYQQAGPAGDGSDRSIESSNASFRAAFAASTVVNNFTMEMWVQVFSYPVANSAMFYNGNGAANGWGILLTSTGHFEYLAGGVAIGSASSTLLSLGTWYYLVVLRRAGTWEYWVNNVKEAASPGTTAPLAASAALQLPGGTHDQHTAYMAVYDVALTSTQIGNHFAAMPGGGPSPFASGGYIGLY